MLLLFASNKRLRYKQDVLDATAYPAGHVIRWRYRERDVDRKIAGNLRGGDERSEEPRGRYGPVLLLYTEPDKALGGSEFSYFAVRYGSMLRIKRSSDKFYFWISLAGYPAMPLANPDSDESACNRIRRLPTRPILRTQCGTGFVGGVKRAARPEPFGPFVVWYDDESSEARLLLTPSWRTDKQEDWEATVNGLSQSTAFSKSVFFRVPALEERSVGLGCSKLWHRVVSSNDSEQTVYRVRSTHMTRLSCRTHHPRPDGAKSVPVIQVETTGVALAGASPRSIPVDSTYNEWDVGLVVNRVLDRATGAVRIAAGGCSTATPPLHAPDITLPCMIVVPFGTKLLIFALFFLGGVLLSMTAADCDAAIKCFRTGEMADRLASIVCCVAKVSGGLLVSYGAMVAFQRLPIRAPS
jgi:hypothetical protein